MMLPNSAMQAIALVEASLTMAILLSMLAARLLFKNTSETRFLSLRVLSCGVLVNLFFWPLQSLGLPLELPLAGYFRAFTGDLSMVSILLLWTAYFSKKPIAIPSGIKAGIAIVAIAFYPFALGVGMVDPYAWGYGSLIFLGAVVCAALIVWLAGGNRLSGILALAIFAWTVGWHESSNLWDYILDPFLGIWAIAEMVRLVIHRRHTRQQSGYLFRKG